MSLALYRKYRPKQLKDLIGQENLISTLKKAASLGKVFHGLIFFGPKGTGKTTTARIYAKLINCENQTFVKTNGEPCAECPSCLTIDSQKTMDIVEIDAASNRGIDEIRSLKEQVRQAPGSLKYKVFIIDEAHMLTKEAWNALLKLLEEPPEHAVFILATTEQEKIPGTILSRAQKFNLKKLTQTEIIQKLKFIRAAENLSVSDELLNLIASRADGGLRDAETLLDQLISFAGDLDLDTAEKIIGKTSFKKIYSFAESLIEKNSPAAIIQLKELTNLGADLPDLNKSLIFYLTDLLTIHLNPKEDSLIKDKYTDEQLAQTKTLATKINIDSTIKTIKKFIESYEHIKYTPFGEVVLEVAIIESTK